MMVTVTDDLSLAFLERSLDPYGKKCALSEPVTMLDLLALQFSTQTHGQLFAEIPADYS
jgi:hypothetical protein